MSSSTSRKRLAKSVASVMFTNGVYFPNYKIYSGATPGMMNYSCISHVYYAFASVLPDGSVFLSDEYTDVQAPCDGVRGGLGSLMHLKQAHPHLQVVLSVGGGNSSETYPVVAGSALLRDNFARAARGLVEASGLDGIDICWKYPSDAKQGRDFVSLLAAVRLHMPEEHFFLSAALPAAPAVLQHVDLATAAAYLDCIHLTAFDFCGPWAARSGHHAQLYALGKDEGSGSAGVAFLVGRGVPAKKIVLGVPTHGRSFLGVSGPGHRFRGVGGGDGMSDEYYGAFEYKQLPRRGAREAVDKRVGAAMCVGGDGGFVSYDNPDTVRMKASYCRQKGLGGLFYWDGPADAPHPSRSLIAAGFRALHTS